MSRTYSQQKAGLTRARKSGDLDKIIAECKRTVNEWRSNPDFPAWPDDWRRWEITLEDAWREKHGWNRTAPSLASLVDHPTTPKTAAEILIEAYAFGEYRGGSTDWDDVNRAFEAAKKEHPGYYDKVLLSHINGERKQNA